MGHGREQNAQGAKPSARDGEFSLISTALLFADGTVYNNEAFVSSVQFSNGRRSDAYLEALGGPGSGKIPGAINVGIQAGQATVSWTGDVGLESAASPAGPWQLVSGATSPYPVSLGGSGNAVFYRPSIH